MNKVIVGIVAAVLVAGVGVFVLDSNENETDVSTNTTQTSSSEPAAESSEDSPPTEIQTVSAANYVEYSDTALADAEGTDRVLFFHAEWCSTCKFYEADIKESGVPEGITIIQASYEDDELKAKYGVNVQSTFVLLDKNGEVQKTWPFASGLGSASDLYEAVLEA